MEARLKKSVRIKALLLALVFSMSIVLPVAATAVEAYDAYVPTANMELTTPGNDAGEAPANDVPANETPANEEPVNDVPANETPANEEPVNEVPANEAPANEEPVNEVPANEAPSNEGATKPAEDKVDAVTETAVAGVVAAAEEIAPLCALCGCCDMPAYIEVRFDFFIGSISAFIDNALARAFSASVTIPADAWGDDLLALIPAEILVQIPTIGYAPVMWVGGDWDGNVEVMYFLIQPLNDLSLYVEFCVDFPEGYCDLPEGFDPNPFFVGGFSPGDVVTLEMILGFIYEETGFDGTGFGTPQLKYLDGADYVIISAEDFNWAIVNFPLLEETPPPPPVLCPDCEKYPCECEEEIPDKPAPADPVTRRPATGPQTGDSATASNTFAQLAALAVIMMTIAGTGLLRTREQS